MEFTIKVQEASILSAFNRLLDAGQHLTPVMKAIGEDVVARTKTRFDTGTDPAGNRWQPNARATIEAYIRAKNGINTKNGKPNKSGKVPDYQVKGKISYKGAGIAMNKRPLHGLGGDLARQFDSRADDNSVKVVSTMAYAGIQQFGGAAGKGRRVIIPSRPFLPITLSGNLYPDEQAQILATLSEHLRRAWDGR
jgi:phage gpG-like protein